MTSGTGQTLSWVVNNGETPKRKRSSNSSPVKSYTTRFACAPPEATSSSSSAALGRSTLPGSASTQPPQWDPPPSTHTWSLPSPVKSPQREVRPSQSYIGPIPSHPHLENAASSAQGASRGLDRPSLQRPPLVATTPHANSAAGWPPFAPMYTHTGVHLAHLPGATSGSPLSGTPGLSRSRKRAQDENEPPLPFPQGPAPKKRKYRKKREKLSNILDYIYDELDWTLAEFLYALFNYGDNVRRDERHRASVSSFLQGRAENTPAQVLDLWFRHPDGRINEYDTEYNKMYSAHPVDVSGARSVRVALTTFAAQVVAKQLQREAERAIEPDNGLHASRKKKKGEDPTMKTKIVWADIGAATASRAAGIIEEFQPLLHTLLLAVAERPASGAHAGAGDVRKNRPAEIVVANVISNLNFSRSNRANLLPLARGLLHFALSAPYDIFHYNSRIGFMPAYTTVYRVLEQLAEHEAETVRIHGKNPDVTGCIWFDNVQNYLLQRDARIGRVNALRIGIAATYVESPDTPTAALDFDDKQRRLAANKRAALTVPQLIGFVDQRHREIVGVLHWLRVLVTHIPELAPYKASVSLWFRTRAAKQRLPEKPAVVHPLATSGKNETITAELKDGLVDFLEQCGQEPEDYHRRLILCGGDGLTYEKMIQLKNYLRFHSDSFESLAVVQPVLAPWHTVWTDTSRVIEAHWGAYLSPDPSTLGHNAAKLKRRPPPNLRKVDFDSGSELVRISFEARVLDCWRIHFKTDNIFNHFSELAKKKAIPAIEDLEAIAKKLYRAYCTQHAAERALDRVADRASDLDNPKTHAWKAAVPLGSAWTPLPLAPTATSPSMQCPSSDRPGSAAKDASATIKKTSQKAPVDGEPFGGDRALANTISFMTDACVLEEFNYAMAEGDVGRVYEAMKMLLFTFAGSAHSKYTSYLLEFICALELESSQDLREAILASMLINLSGDPGRFAPSDLIQEYFNRLLQAIAERKGAEYHDRFLRRVVSRNLHHLARLCDDLKKGIGLQSRSGHHSAPQLRTELQKLLDAYQDSELHSRRPGRTYVTGDDNTRVTDYRRGLANLRTGKLARWKRESGFMRGKNAAHSNSGTSAGTSGEVNTPDDEDTDTEDAAGPPSQTMDEPDTESSAFALGALTSSHLVDGDLVSVRLDAAIDAAHILEDIRKANAEAAEPEDEDAEDDLRTSAVGSDEQYWSN